MQPLDGLVRVVGAAGQEVPFLGYVELDISFPRTEAGTDKVFQTPVLVVPDNQYNLRGPLILGTNLAKQCRDVCQQEGGVAFLQRMAVSGVWKRAYGALRSQENFHARCASGSVKVNCTAKHPVTIAAHQTVVLWGLTHTCPGELTKVVVEPLDKLQQHSSLEVTPGLVSLSPSGSTCRVPVEVTNNSAQPVTLPPKTSLASLKVASEVCKAQNKDEACNNVDVDLSVSTLSPEQVDQVKDILTRMSYVFSKGSKDLGNTTEIAHEIRLTDDIPIRDPYRRLSIVTTSFSTWGTSRICVRSLAIFIIYISDC